MGTYATTTGLADLLIGVDLSATAQLAMADKCITQAESKVNLFLSQRYDLSSAVFQSSATIPPLVRTTTEIYAEGLAWLRNSRGSKTRIDMGTTFIEEAKECLQGIVDYKTSLTDTAGSLITENPNGAYRIQSNTKNYTETFAEDNYLNWGVDSDKLTDIASDRL